MERQQQLDLTGQRFGRLVVIRRVRNGRPTHNSVWLCRCDCNAETEVARPNLRSKHIRSCGCYRSDLTAELNRRRGRNAVAKSGFVFLK